MHNLTQRLYDSGAEFNGEIIEQTDPWITILISWVLPIVIFIALGQYMSKKMTEKCRRTKFNDVWDGQEQCKGICQVI